MEKLSPEDISRARELALPLAVELTPFEPGDAPYKRNVTEIQQDIAAVMLAYSAAENERLTEKLEQERAKTDVELEDLAEAAESRVKELEQQLQNSCRVANEHIHHYKAKRDRLKAALRDMVVIAQQDGWHNALTGRQIVLEAAEAALRPEGE